MFTWNRRKRSSASRHLYGGPAGSLLQFACTAASRHADWILQAIEALRHVDGVERVGVWLDETQALEEMGGSPAVFRGDVWERGIGNGLPEWSRLSDNAPVPRELLNQGKSCEYDLHRRHSGVVVGVLVGLEHVLWVPVMVQRSLRGIILLGSRVRQAALPQHGAKQIAEELAILLELEESRKLAASRKADLELHRYVQELRRKGQNANMVLKQLAESCTRGVALGGVGAEFALVGEAKTGPDIHDSASVGSRERLELKAHSGETDCAYSMNEGPLESFWRQALRELRTIGVESDRLPLLERGLRMVAIPLGQGKDLCGVLVAGFHKRKASLETLDRLEFRALLASEVLEAERRTKAADEQHAWYKAMLESSDTPVVLADDTGIVRGMSHGARELFGHAEAIADFASGTVRFRELFQPSAWKPVQQWLENERHTERGQEAASTEIELSAGQSVILSRLAIPGESGLAIRLDKTRNQKKTRSIEEVEQELRQAIEWLEEGVLVFDQYTELVAYNRRALQILGVHNGKDQMPRNLEELIRITAANFAAPELFAAEWRTLATNGAAGTQEELAMEKPVPQVIERCARPILSPAGKNLGHVEVYREVTARRMFQSRMLNAEKLASLGQRVTGIMHELSNPLTTILGNAQRMTLRGEAETPPPEAHSILEEAQRATTILRQLLDVSREIQPERRLVSLNEVVERTIRVQGTTLAGGSLSLRIDTDERLPRVLGDASQLQQVLFNLLHNAQQAIELSGRGTTIGVRTFCFDPDRVRLEVWDDGPGIPESLQARIFDPFFTTKPTGLGTGLGLAIVHGFVRQHGGSISVHCPPEGGTRFLVDFPAGESPHETERRPTVPVMPSNGNGNGRSTEGGSGPGGGKNVVASTVTKPPHILVVEDEATVANLIADVLRDQGIKVDVLLDGHRALEAARHTRYDLAICDLKMPGMGGHSFYEKLQQEQNPLREHTLFVTGDIVAPRTHDFLKRNHLPHVAKPFRVEELCEAVRALLRGADICAGTMQDSPSEHSGDGIQP